jgi:hypothetical protein
MRASTLPTTFAVGFTIVVTLLRAMSPALAQNEDLQAPFALSDQIVVNFVASFDEVAAAADKYEKLYNIEVTDDLEALLQAFGTHADALAELNDLSAKYGFRDIGEWLHVYLTIAAAAMVADLNLTAEQRAAMMVPSLDILEENMLVVTRHSSELHQLLQPGG